MADKPTILAVGPSYLYVIQETPTSFIWDRYWITPSAVKPSHTTHHRTRKEHEEYLALLHVNRTVRMYNDAGAILKLFPPSIHTRRLIELFGPNPQPSNISFLTGNDRRNIEAFGHDPKNPNDLIHAWCTIENVIHVARNDPDFDLQASDFDHIPVQLLERLQRRITYELGILRE